MQTGQVEESRKESLEKEVEKERKKERKGGASQAVEGMVE